MKNIENLKREIMKDSQEFIRQNRGLKIDPRSKKANAYLSPRISSEFMDCSLPMTFDQYSFCSMSCTYCFAYYMKSQNLSFSHKLHSVNYEKLIPAIRGDSPTGRFKAFHKNFFSKRFLFHWGGLADPFCSFEKVNGIGYKIISVLAKEKYPTLFSCKGSAINRPKFEKLFTKYAHQKNFAFQVSVVCPSDDMSRKIEIGVPVTSRRIKLLKKLSGMGYYTILRLRPFIIGVTDQGLGELLDQAKEAGINAISTEFMAIDNRHNEHIAKRYKWIGEIIGTNDLLNYFKALSPSKRGGYLRLNRLVKERFIKQIYKFCLDNDIVFTCSDPDYKELNMSGCCCGLPDVYKENKEMQNWAKNQLTFYLKEARRKFHLDGELYKFRFTTVFNSKKSTFLVDDSFGNNHIGASGMTASQRDGLTYLNFARDVWNNLRSPGNPRNYFHGKMLPISIDENENYVYVYNPSEYEDRWLKEGIDLTK